MPRLFLLKMVPKGGIPQRSELIVLLTLAKCRRISRLNQVTNGNIAQGFFGVKAGKRFEKWGIFAKARPGTVSFSKGDNKFVATGTGSSFPFQFQQKPLTNAAVDLGGIIEFYPSKRIVTRFEGGDTLIHYRQRQSNFLSFDPITFAPVLIPFTTRSETRHTFQFSAGVGWRF